MDEDLAEFEDSELSRKHSRTALEPADSELPSQNTLHRWKDSVESVGTIFKKLVVKSEKPLPLDLDKSDKERRIKWKKLRNSDRFFHSELKRHRKVNKREIAKQARLESVQQKQSETERNAKVIALAFSDHHQTSRLAASPRAGSTRVSPQMKPTTVTDVGSVDSSFTLSSDMNHSYNRDDTEQQRTPMKQIVNLEEITESPTMGAYYILPLSSESEKPKRPRFKSQSSDGSLGPSTPIPIDKKPLTDTDDDHFAYFEPDNNNNNNKIKKKRSHRRIVFFDGKLKRLAEINTADETFHVVFHFYLTWLMSKKEVEEYFAAKETSDDFEEWEPKWAPKLECDNRVEGEISRMGPYKCKEGSSFKCLPSQDPSTDFSYPFGRSSFDIRIEDLGFDPRYAFWCRVQYNCEIRCAEELELELFPFDCQDFGIYMKLTDKADKCDILPWPRHGEIFNVAAPYSMVSEWKIPGVMLEFGQGDPMAAKNGVPYNTVVIRVKATRKWQAHLADSITIFCMFWLGLATFSIPVEEVGDRLAYCITLLLADIATMQLLNESIPKIPYQTLLDLYTYACFLFLVSVTVFVSISGFGGEPRIGHVQDWWAFWIFFIVVLFIHVWFVRMIHLGRMEEKTKLKMNTEELDAFFARKSNLHSITAMPNASVSWSGKSIVPMKQWKDYSNHASKIPHSSMNGQTHEDGYRWYAHSYPWSKPADSGYVKSDPLLRMYHENDTEDVFRNRWPFVALNRGRSVDHSAQQS